MKKFLSLLLILSVPVLAMDQPQSTVVTADEDSGDEQDVKAVTATIEVLQVGEDATPNPTTPDTDEDTTTSEEGSKDGAAGDDARLPIETATDDDKSVEEVVEVREVQSDKA
jgi:hypothetical protein